MIRWPWRWHRCSGGFGRPPCSRSRSPFSARAPGRRRTRPRSRAASTSSMPAPATAAIRTIRTAARSSPAAAHADRVRHLPRAQHHARRETGIGRWTAEDFRRAMIEGVSPDGSHYYPVFPYRWYTGMTEQDIADLWAYLRIGAARRATGAGARPAVPVQHPLPAAGLEAPQLRPGRDACPTPSGRRPGTAAPIWSTTSATAAPATRRSAVRRAVPERQVPRRLGGDSRPLPRAQHHAARGDRASATGRRGHRARARALDHADGVPIRGPMAEYVASGSSHLSEAGPRGRGDLPDLARARGGPGAREREDGWTGGCAGREPQSGTEGAAGGGGMGSAGMGLLSAAGGGRTRAK